MSEKKYFIDGTHPTLGRAPKKKSLLGTLIFLILLGGASVGGYYLHLHLKSQAGQQRPDIVIEPTAAVTEPVTVPGTPVKAAPAPVQELEAIAPPPPVKKPEPAPETAPKKEPETASTPAERSQADLMRQRFKEIDGLAQAGKYDEAKSKLAAILTENLPPKFLAATHYRQGILLRRAQEENAAQEAWKTAAQKYPETQAGRMSALALGDTWFSFYASANPQFDKWEAIRDMYSLALEMDGARFIPKNVRERVISNLTQLNQRLVFSPVPTGDCFMHTVTDGDSQSSIASKYGLNWTALAAVNHLTKDSVLRKGQQVKIVGGQCLILVDKTELTLTWYLDGKWVARYPCAVGPDNKTPVGDYSIISMDVDPDWTSPLDGKVYPFGHPENILGTRWVGLKGGDTQGLGIHGTGKPESIPGRTSNGCVRLLNKHVEELYGFVTMNPGQETKVKVFE